MLPVSEITLGDNLNNYITLISHPISIHSIVNIFVLFRI